jgi:hypothetical protein
VVVSVAPRRWIHALLVAAAVLAVASATVQVLAHGFSHEDLSGLRPMFDMMFEANLPSWFSGAVLLACAGALGVVSLAARRKGDDARGWAALSALFGAASVDEVATIHETLAIDLHGSFTYLVPGTLLLLAAGASLRGFFARLPVMTRIPLLLGIATWTLGAVALEGAEALLDPATDTSLGVGLALLNTLQDTLELLGMIIVLDAVIQHASRQKYRVTLAFERD